MQITTSTTKSYTLTLSEIELENYLEEPKTLIDQLRRARLNGHTPPNKADDHYHKGAIHGKITKARKAKATHKTSGPGLELIACPKCGMTVKARGLLIHQRGSKCDPALHPTLEEK